MQDFFELLLEMNEISLAVIFPCTNFYCTNSMLTLRNYVLIKYCTILDIRLYITLQEYKAKNIWLQKLFIFRYKSNDATNLENISSFGLYIYEFPSNICIV